MSWELEGTRTSGGTGSSFGSILYLSGGDNITLHGSSNTIIIRGAASGTVPGIAIGDLSSTPFTSGSVAFSGSNITINTSSGGGSQYIQIVGPDPAAASLESFSGTISVYSGGVFSVSTQDFAISYGTIGVETGTGGNIGGNINGINFVHAERSSNAVSQNSTHFARALQFGTGGMYMYEEVSGNNVAISRAGIMLDTQSGFRYDSQHSALSTMYTTQDQWIPNKKYVDDNAGGGGVAIQDSATTFTSGTINFANSNGLAFGISSDGQLTGSYTVPPSGTLSFVNSNGVSFGSSSDGSTTSVSASVETAYVPLANSTKFATYAVLPKFIHPSCGFTSLGAIGQTNVCTISSYSNCC
jgi:hypothetical protein